MPVPSDDQPDQHEARAGEAAKWVPPTLINAVFDTERLAVRPFRLSEIDALFERINGCREHLAPWVPWAIDGHRTPAQTAEYVTRQLLALEKPSSFAGVGLGVFERSSGRLVGGTGVHDVHRETASCEAGYWISLEAAGHGYAGEACAATISWALRSTDAGGLGFRRVRVICAAANARSLRVIEKLGLPRELCQRDDFNLPGIGLTDRLGFGVLRGEWDTDAHRMTTAR